MIEIKGVSLEIKKKKILSDINAGFGDGQIHGLVGRNGCGKTMLMKCICGFIHPTSGSIRVNEKLVGKEIDFPQKLGVIIETPNFIPYFSGYHNLKILSDYRHCIGKKEIYNVLETVGLADVAKMAVRKYSLGMRQRLAIAQAVMEEPEILVLDEPFNGLDREGVSEMRKVLLQLRDKGSNIVLSSHNEEDIGILCSDVLHMENGKLI
ncbi:MAG: ATP-binding cassette domain-containing protein [Lachnospiraceae bacterium]|nr:ATP-binding cassette domain-containing protein [Lachnospiraceae bacterium]